ncbi:MAG: hypothetical protein JWO31_1825 [Phycisphaerales bacterium]|nr:hypothetical protein [Phycisphaerales bacterium]
MTCRRPARALCRLAPALLLSLVAAGTGGCSVLGLAAARTTSLTVKPTYAGLAGQSLGVMVSVDRGTQIDYPRLQLDIAQVVDADFRESQRLKADELKGTQFPATANPQAVFAFQRNYPDLEAEPVVNVAPKLGVSRLIYLEVDSFTLNPTDVLELFRGEVVGRVKVVEVTNGVGKVVYDDQVSATFPEKGPEQGTPNLNRATTYRGAISAFGTAVVQKFVAYETN